MRPGRHCDGAAFAGRQYGILKFGRLWRIGVFIAERIRREFALRYDTRCYFKVRSKAVITHPHVLFVRVHTNVVVVTTRISVADLIGGGGNTDVCPGRQTPSRRHCMPMYNLSQDTTTSLGMTFLTMPTGQLTLYVLSVSRPRPICVSTCRPVSMTVTTAGFSSP